MRGIGIIVIFFFILHHSRGQETFRETDSLTFSLYNQGNWKDLITAGKHSLRLGYDYYYLRMRMGIAHYSRENYIESQLQFQKALAQNPGDPVAAQYLYYAYLFSGRNLDADHLFYGLQERIRNEIKPEGTRKFLRAEGYVSYQKNTEGSAFDKLVMPDNSPSGYQTIPQSLYAGVIGLSHRAGKHLTIYHQYTYLSKSYFQFYKDETGDSYTGEKTLSENLYYLRANMYLAPGMNLVTSMHFLNERIPLAPGGRQGFGKASDALVFNEFVWHTGMYKYFGPFNAGIGLSYSNLSGSVQYQQSGRLSVMPFGNLNFYLASEMVYQQEKSAEGSTQHGKAYQTELGLKLHTHLWLEGKYLWGNLHHFNMSDGLFLYNNDEYLKRSFSLGLMIPTSNNHLQFRLSMSSISEESRYVSTTIQSQFMHTIPVLTIVITGGVSWKF